MSTPLEQMSPETLSLREQVAQRFVAGFSGNQPNSTFQEFIKTGLGGVIFFRQNFETFSSPVDVARFLHDLTQQFPQNMPAPFLALDQEGGQIERLPHTIFPSLVSPLTVALYHQYCQPDSREYCAEIYDLLAFYLSMLGFNMNFAPTLDVNLNPENPVIGVRSFGSDPLTVSKFSKVVLDRFEARGIIAVGKHFPGHGNGTVDSHESMPTLKFTEEELQPFKDAIALNIPAMMVSHGYYAELQKEQIPASMSSQVVTDLLRKQCGYDGLVISDDMAMGAVSGDPVEAALKSFEAGVDVLIYREAGETQWQIFNAVVAAIEEGRLDRKAHEQSLERILEAKKRIKRSTGNFDSLTKIMTPENIQSVSDYANSKAVVRIDGEIPGPPELNKPLWVIHPNRKSIHHYMDDAATSEDLADRFRNAGFLEVTSLPYNYNSPSPHPIPLPQGEGEDPACIVFVTYNPGQDKNQADWYWALSDRYPNASFILVSAGMPEAGELIPYYDVHFAMCTYRPNAMKALVDLLTPPPVFEKPDLSAFNSDDDDDFDEAVWE